MGGVIGWLRRTFVRGMLLILPLMISILILTWLFRMLTRISTPAAVWTLQAAGAPIEDHPALSWAVPLIGVLATVGVVLLVGVVGGNYLGKRAWATFEAMLLRLPIMRWFYGSARQLMDAVSASGRGAFREVVLVEYPRRGVWCLGFVTSVARLGPALPDEEMVYVFLPTTPNPTSGYTIILPRSEAPPAGMTVDEGMKVIFSGGFISPPAGAGARRP